GKGVNGYDDDVNLIPELQPLNPYGESKQDFDKWAIQHTETPPAWYGLKFFNVYGPYEFHKGRMASVVYHAYNQIKATGKMKLFKSYRPEYQDGMQLRDFVFVNDVVDIMFWLYKNRPENGIYNVGTGKARSFIDLVNAVFAAMNRQPNIEFIDMPEDIRDKYQYFTEAKIEKLRSVGYDAAMTSLEDGVKQYIDFLEKCNV
ncbi:MAG: NAD-dependent epimerase/dehydratase family protein, partial [Bacteroidales bacterium]|nr:NAD-dependent epimerase/dehydratase family protein [Bacteroidales bacterium]